MDYKLLREELYQVRLELTLLSLDHTANNQRREQLENKLVSIKRLLAECLIEENKKEGKIR